MDTVNEGRAREMADQLVESRVMTAMQEAQDVYCEQHPDEVGIFNAAAFGALVGVLHVMVAELSDTPCENLRVLLHEMVDEALRPRVNGERKH